MTDTLLDRVPPQSIEAEQSVLGSLLISREAHFALREVGLEPADFYREAHEILFATVCGMYDREETVDIITVQEALRGAGRLEQCGGIEYIMALIDSVPTAVHARYYGEIVRDKAVRRQWLDVAGRIIGAAHDGETDAAQISAIANDGDLAITKRLSIGGDWTPYSEIIPAVVGQIEEAYTSGEDLKGIPSGIPALDNLTCGWQDRDLILIAARPSNGKTALMLQLAEQSARAGYPVGIFSLEMDRGALGMRALQAETHMSGYALRQPRFGDEGWRNIMAATGRLTDLPVYIDDEPVVSYAHIFPKARRAVMEHGVRLLMCDYAQLVEGPRGESRNREVGMIVRAMRTTAKRLGVPFIALSQLSRRCEQENRKPRLSDLRDSGEIEQEINVCVFIHIPEKPADGEDCDAELILAKNRQLAQGVVPVRWVPRLMRFVPRTGQSE
ncbi:MAG: replicative DNA helicase [Armatimonadetes bacterium]|nr:replicative DNA helicase [Armatimonadota bacterium]